MGSGSRAAACRGMPNGDAPAVGSALRYRSNIVRLQCEPARWPRSLAFRGAKPRRSSSAGNRGLRTHGPAGNVVLRKVGSPRKGGIGDMKELSLPVSAISSRAGLTFCVIAEPAQYRSNGIGRLVTHEVEAQK
jgi:hypothetical protein